MTSCSTWPGPLPDPGSGGALLTSGEFARRSRLSMKALRLYDRIGLLRPAVVEPGNGYRRYAESQLDTARLIALLRRLDMPLAQIATITATRGPGGAELLDRYWAEVEERLAAQRGLADRLVRSLAGETPTPGPWEVHTREVPEQLVLTEQRLVTIPQLSWQREAAARLTAVADRHGGPAGPRFVVFHASPTEDVAAPVEVCVPVAADPGDAAVRVEPAHREAYTPVSAGDFEPPRILSVYDTLRRWAGGRVAGPPREVYSYETGPVCDVALPVQ
jgi:DNA-binding transcriptional MerR regulator